MRATSSVDVVRYIVKVTRYRNNGTDQLAFQYVTLLEFDSKDEALLFLLKYQRVPSVTPPNFQLPSGYDDMEYIEEMTLSEFERINK